ncbi:MAG: hypothetical protein LBL87_01820 [Ruminococcus sp.]|jgi:hypothetical protein|nr:hypothetical protein [Ruminococcus sp.]
MSEKDNEKPEVNETTKPDGQETNNRSGRDKEILRKKREAARERDKKLAEERRELLKIKAGTATEEEKRDIEEKAVPERHYTVWQKIESFFYLYKTQIVIGGVFLAFVVFLAVNLFTLVIPDVKIGVVTKDASIMKYTENISALLTPFCTDTNGDGKVEVQVSYFGGPVTADRGAPTSAETAEVIKLSSDFRSDTAVMYIIDKKAIADMELTADILTNGETLFPGDKNAVALGYALKNTDFAEQIGYTDMADDFIVVFRTPQTGMGDFDTFKKSYENAVTLWKNYINDNPAYPEGD